MKHRYSPRALQRGYAAIPYIASFFTAGASAGGAAAGGAAAGAAAGGAAAAGTAAAATGAAAAGAAGVSAGVAAAGTLGAAAYTAALGVGASKLLAPKSPSIAGMAPPTIDQAAQQQQTSDRLRRRTGVLANIYGGGGTAGAPSVGSAKLLGG